VRHPWPASRRRPTSSTFTKRGLRPMCTPWAGARAWPARTRSPMRARSCFATQAKTANEEIPDRPASVEPRLLMALHADACRAELVEVAGRRTDALTGETIKRPEQQHIELATVRTSEHGSKRRAITPRAAHRLGVHGDHLEAESARPPAELAFLVFDSLLGGAHSHVERRPPAGLERGLFQDGSASSVSSLPLASARSSRRWAGRR
jgi:hypothetical protein